MRSEGWISQIPPRLRSSAFSIRVESINFNFSSQSIIYFLCLYTRSLSPIKVIYFEKLQKIQIVYRGVGFQLNQSIVKDICISLVFFIPPGTWIFSWYKILVCTPGFPADISLSLIWFQKLSLTVRFLLRMSHHSFLTKKRSMKTMDMYMAMMMITTSIPLSMDIMPTQPTLQFDNQNLKQCHKIPYKLLSTTLFVTSQCGRLFSSVRIYSAHKLYSINSVTSTYWTK